MQTKTIESGNVLFMILIAVILFAALSYAVSNSSRTGTNTLDKDILKADATEIINHFSAIQAATTRLIARGCDLSQISFEEPRDGNQFNPSAPSNKSCHVFRPEGGGVPPKYLKEEWLSTDIASASGNDYYYVTGSDSITDIGTTCTTASCADLIVNIWDLTKELCEVLNELSGEKGLNTVIPSDSLLGEDYEGSFRSSPRIVFTSAALRGKIAACYRDTVFGYVFTSVAIAR